MEHLFDADFEGLFSVLDAIQVKMMHYCSLPGGVAVGVVIYQRKGRTIRAFLRAQPLAKGLHEGCFSSAQFAVERHFSTLAQGLCYFGYCFFQVQQGRSMPFHRVKGSNLLRDVAPLPALMRAVIQRVSQASVTVDGQEKARIGWGLLILLGIEHEDGPEDAEWLSKKIAAMRIFSDDAGLMNLSVQDIQGELLVVSQFTLHASTKKGNRPSFIRAARPEHAIPLYEAFIHLLERDSGRPVRTGVFGGDMKVLLLNDGPVTIWMDSRNRE